MNLFAHLEHVSEPVPGKRFFFFDKYLIKSTHGVLQTKSERTRQVVELCVKNDTASSTGLPVPNRV